MIDFADFHRDRWDSPNLPLRRESMGPLGFTLCLCNRTGLGSGGCLAFDQLSN